MRSALDTGGTWSGGARLRYFGQRPLVEDNSVHSKASTLVNLQVGYRYPRVDAPGEVPANKPAATPQQSEQPAPDTAAAKPNEAAEAVTQDIGENLCRGVGRGCIQCGEAEWLPQIAAQCAFLVVAVEQLGHRAVGRETVVAGLQETHET